MKLSNMYMTLALLILVGAPDAGALAESSDQETEVVTIRCESESGERRHCPADTSAGVAMTGRTGEEGCLLGKTWGYDDAGVWVEGGCGAIFVLGGTERMEKGEGVLRSFNPYVSFLGHVAFFDDEAEIQDNVSWLGLKFSTGENVRLFAHFEVGTNLIGGAESFRPGSRTDSGLLVLEEVEEPDVFGSRLGYLGLDFGKAGKISLGKDLAQHYAIASYTTDRFNAFGGQGSLAYPGGGDGGTTGTGRADQVLNYRVPVGERVDLGAQVQFSNSVNDELVDGYGASLQLEILPGLKVGGAYTEIEIEEFFGDEITGLDGDAKYFILGLDYSSDVVDVGLVWATQENGDGRQVALENRSSESGAPKIPVVFDGDGLELYVRGKVGKWGLVGGFINYDPDTAGTPFDLTFEDKYFIVGADWALAESAWIYTEFRIDDSSGPGGESGTSVGVVGLHYVFSVNSSLGP